MSSRAAQTRPWYPAAFRRLQVLGEHRVDQRRHQPARATPLRHLRGGARRASASRTAAGHPVLPGDRPDPHPLPVILPDRREQSHPVPSHPPSVSGKQQNVTTIRAAAPHVPQPGPACRRKPAPRRGQIRGELTRPARSQVEPNQRRRWGQFRVTRPAPVVIRDLAAVRLHPGPGLITVMSGRDRPPAGGCRARQSRPPGGCCWLPPGRRMAPPGRAWRRQNRPICAWVAVRAEPALGRAKSAFGACCPSVASLSWSLAVAGMPGSAGGVSGCWLASAGSVASASPGWAGGAVR